MSVELSGVSFTYQAGTVYERTALNDVSLRVADGECVGIMGETGCGKSTLAQIVAGLLSPSEGTVRFDNLEVRASGPGLDAVRRSVGIAFQYPENQLFGTTIERDVAFAIRRSGLSQAEISARVRQALESVSLNFDELRDLSPLGLSGGEKRRVALAGILVSRPRVLVLDEPTASVDPRFRDVLIALLDDLRRGGTTIIIVSHDADFIAESCERLLVFTRGRLTDDGPVPDVFSRIGVQSDVCVGRVWSLCRSLRERGFSVPDDIVRYCDLRDALRRIVIGRCTL